MGKVRRRYDRASVAGGRGPVRVQFGRGAVRRPNVPYPVRSTSAHWGWPGHPRPSSTAQRSTGRGAHHLAAHRHSLGLPLATSGLATRRSYTASSSDIHPPRSRANRFALTSVGSMGRSAYKSVGFGWQAVLDWYSVSAESTASEYHIGPGFVGDWHNGGLQAGGRRFESQIGNRGMQTASRCPGGRLALPRWRLAVAKPSLPGAEAIAKMPATAISGLESQHLG